MRELKYIRYYSIGIAIKFFLDDNDGKAHAKPVICYAGRRILEFKAE